MLNEDDVSSAPFEAQAPRRKGEHTSSVVGELHPQGTHPWLIAAANSTESAARTQAEGVSSLSIASAHHYGKKEEPNIAAQAATTQASVVHATANADIHDGLAQHASGEVDQTVTNVRQGLAVRHQQSSNAAVDGAALVNGNRQLPEAVRPSDPLPDAVHAAGDQVVMCNMMTPGSNSNAETAFPPKEAFLSNKQVLAKNVSLGFGEDGPANSLLGLHSDPSVQRGSNRAERRAKQKEEKAKAAALANAERKKDSRAVAARMVCHFLHTLFVLGCISALNAVLAVLKTVSRHMLLGNSPFT